MCQPNESLQRQFNRTSQLIGEKVGRRNPSEVDYQITELSHKVDAVRNNISKMQRKINGYLQPNSKLRATMAVQTCVSPTRGVANSVKNSQPEFKLARVLKKAGKGLEDGSRYANSLTSLGSAFGELSELKDDLVEDVQSGILTPLYDMQHKDIKEIMAHRKKLENRRLDYEYKKSRSEKFSPEEFEIAREKFEESKRACLYSMTNFIVYGEEDHIRNLLSFAEAVKSYHSKCADVMQKTGAVLSSNYVQDENEVEKVSRRSESVVSKQFDVNPYAYEDTVMYVEPSMVV